MDKLTLKAEERKLFGRKIKKLRNEGLLPANVFGSKIKSVAVHIDKKEFATIFKKAGETGVVNLSLGKEERPVLIHNIQTHPVSDEPLHVDFLQVDLKQKVSANVPVELQGESVAEKQGVGTVVQHIDEIEVEALPMDLPENFIVDISGLEQVDQAIYIKDLKYDKNKISIATDADEIIVKVEALEKIEEPVVAAPTEEGVEEGKEKTEVEGEKKETSDETKDDKVE